MSDDSFEPKLRKKLKRLKKKREKVADLYLEFQKSNQCLSLDDRIKETAKLQVKLRRLDEKIERITLNLG
jgi:ppGpp synthetase/RelA/SpoT-type nucleotidyltranferase